MLSYIFRGGTGRWGWKRQASYPPLPSSLSEPCALVESFSFYVGKLDFQNKSQSLGNHTLWLGEWGL